MKIDIHAHFAPRDCFDMVDDNGKKFGPSIDVDPSGQELLTIEGFKLGPVARQLYDPQARLADMNRMGVDMQAVSVPPTHFFYNTNSDLGLCLSQKLNDAISEMTKAYPGRFVGIANVPMQDIGKAGPELKRAVKQLGLKGVQINSNINGKNLDEPELLPFFEAAAALDVPVFIHPHYVAGVDRLSKYYLTNLIGNPFDTTIAIASLIFGGILEKFPKLKFVCAHAGGCAPYIQGRWEHGYRHVWGTKYVLPKPPGEYLKKMYFDTIAHYKPALNYLASTQGVDYLVMGSDYPFDMADMNPVSSVNQLAVSSKDKEKIMRTNAEQLLKI